MSKATGAAGHGATQTRRSRSQSVDIAKGIGITLVVVGHFNVPGVQPQYWLDLRELIYSSHMPLFMVLAGYLLGYGRGAVDSIPEYAAFVRGKANRLLWPYFTITLLYFVVKGAAGFLFKLQWPVSTDALSHVLLNPVGGFTTDLWFIYTLFVVFLVFPPLVLLLRSEFAIIAGSILLSFLPWPTQFCLSLVFHYLPYFAAGWVLSRHVLLDGLGWHRSFPTLIVAASLFSVGWATRGAWIPSGIVSQLFSLVLGLSGSGALVLAAVMISRRTVLSRPLAALGVYSTVIYLTHTIPASGLRIAMFSILKFGPSLFIPGALLSCATGLALPALFQGLFIRRGSAAARYLLGEAPRGDRRALPTAAEQAPIT